jgi:RNA polymerase sigma-70 factor (ECF subfamily)
MGILTGISQKRLFRTILANNRNRLYRMAYSWTHDPVLADDLVQQACYQALRKQRHLRDIEAADAWLFRILANCLADHHRVRREVLNGDEIVEVDKRTPEQATQEDQVARKVRDAIATLPLPQRQVVTLIDLEGFAYAAVAEILDIPVGTVMSRLSRGRRALRDRLLDINARDLRTTDHPNMPATVRVIK